MVIQPNFDTGVENTLQSAKTQVAFKTIALHWLLLLFSRSVVSDSLRPHGLQHRQASLFFTIYLPEFAQIHVHLRL